MFMRNSFGFSLVEVIVAISIAVFSILAIWKVYTLFIKISLSNPALFQASFLAEEGIEAMKFMIFQEAKEAGKKVKILRIKKAGDIGKRKFRYRVDLKVLN